MTKVQAAVGVIQLKKLEGFIAARRRLGQQRTEILSEVPELTLPCEPPDCEHSYYLYTVLVPKEWAGEKRDQFNAIMGEDFNIGCLVANPPVHNTVPYIAKFAGHWHLPVSEEIASRLTCICLHPSMTSEQNEYICAATIETVERLRSA